MARNKELCRRCKWHGHNNNDNSVFCYYSGRNEGACKSRDGRDKRGDANDACLLFEEGKPDRIPPKIKRKK